MADFQLVNMFQVGTLHLVAVEAPSVAVEAEAEAPSAPSAAAEESAV
jgi:hypothetical protein